MRIAMLLNVETIVQVFDEDSSQESEESENNIGKVDNFTIEKDQNPKKLLFKSNIRLFGQQSTNQVRLP